MKSGKRNVPFFSYPAIFAQHESDYMEILRDVLGRGAFIMQKDLEAFQNRLADYLGIKHAIGTADGTMAMVTALLAVGVGKGDEVILPSHTFVATAAAVHHVGAKPVLADCGPDHLIDPASVAALITPKTRVLMPVQLNGRTADMDKLVAIAKVHNLQIVEDACQALGSKYKGKFAGTFGKVGAFSFYPSKTLGCFGDGGALVTNNDDVAERVRLLRDHGRNDEGKVECFGFNARLDNVHAAILDYKLKRYREVVERRRAIARLYKERLGIMEQLVLPPGPDDDPDHFDVYQNYEIEAENRDGLKEHLAENGVGTLIQWGGKAVHQFSKLGFIQELPFTERLFERMLMLPMNMSVTDEDVEYVCKCIRDFYAHDVIRSH
jgi:dTDP-4-amino-4,6-dideoxygalactose transaminase